MKLNVVLAALHKIEIVLKLKYKNSMNYCTIPLTVYYKIFHYYFLNNNYVNLSPLSHFEAYCNKNCSKLMKMFHCKGTVGVSLIQTKMSIGQNGIKIGVLYPLILLN